MAPRPVWKGHLKLSLVSCAVELSNATSMSEKVRFRTLNRKTGNPVKRQWIDSVTGKPVDEDDEVKGYELDDKDFLLVEEEDIEKIQIESSHTLAIDSFVENASIEQVYLDQPYYMAPADKVSEEAFAVIRDAMAMRKMAGLARIVLHRRERPVLIEPLDNGLLLTTLRYNALVRAADTVFDDIKSPKIDEEMIELAGSIIDRKISTFDPSKFEDKYETALLALIEAKREGRDPPVFKSAEPAGNVVNLFDALKKSLAGSGGGKDAAGTGPQTVKPTDKKAGKAPAAKEAVKAAERKTDPAKTKPARRSA